MSILQQNMQARGPRKLWRISWSNANNMPHRAEGCKFYSDERYMHQAISKLRANGAMVHIEVANQVEWEIIND